VDFGGDQGHKGGDTDGGDSQGSPLSSVSERPDRPRRQADDKWQGNHQDQIDHDVGRVHRGPSGFEGKYRAGDHDGDDRVDKVRAPEAELRTSGQVPGAAGEAESMIRFRQAIPDVQFTILDQIAERDLVATRLRISGNPTGQFGDVGPEGGVFDVQTMVLFRIEDGRVAEEWLFVNGGTDLRTDDAP